MHKKILKEISFIIAIAILMFFFISLISYHLNIFFNIKIGKYPNIFGIFGYYSAFFLFKFFGFLSYLLLVGIFIFLYNFLHGKKIPLYNIILLFIFIISFGCIITILLPNEFKYISGIIPGKIVYFLYPYFNLFGSFFLYLLIFVISFMILFKVSIFQHFNQLKKRKQHNLNNQIKKVKIKNCKPDISLLNKPIDNSEIKDKNDTEIKKENLLQKLLDLNLKGEIIDITIGPSIALFEFKPEKNVKLSKFKGIEKDIAMALEVENVRILTPIPRKSTVGFEIPLKDRKKVFLREIIESSEYIDMNTPLPLTLGKTIEGIPYIADLIKLPHILIGGSTGSGKSICLHSLILGILFKANINDVRFILIDPKMIEFSLYENLPHLGFPVITDVLKSVEVLNWAIDEMERRYKILAKYHKRDISSYRETENIPYIVIIIDELADLMMSVGKKVEPLIARLAQKGRAAGIHLIIATQRPSVDVLTGVIKNNLPARIAFKVTSNYDSRTIIDTDGAENLLGKGDMLYLEPGKNIIRLQAPFVEVNEIENVVKYFAKFK